MNRKAETSVAGKTHNTGFATPGHDHGACIRDVLARAAALCARRGVRLTEQRRRVLELVWESHAPVGAYALLEKMSSKHGKTAPPTIYRALEFLVAHGLVHRIESQNAYIGCPQPDRQHDVIMLLCEACGLASEARATAVQDALRRTASDADFQVTGITLELRGRCPNCKAAA